MKKLFSLALLATFFTATHAQTADDIIGKYVDAIGGADKLKALQSVYTETVAVMQNGFEINTKVYKVQGKLFRSEVDFGRGSMTMIVTDKEGWFTNPRNDGAFEALPGEAVTNQQKELDILPLFNYAAKGSQAELVGKETINGVEAYNIKLTNKAGKSVNYFIDNKNWYIIRTVEKGTMGGGMFGGGGGGGNRRQEEVEIKIDYSDFKKTSDGYVFPMAVSRPGMGGATVTTNVEKIEINKTIDPKLFKPE